MSKGETVLETGRVYKRERERVCVRETERGVN